MTNAEKDRFYVIRVSMPNLPDRVTPRSRKKAAIRNARDEAAGFRQMGYNVSGNPEDGYTIELFNGEAEVSIEGPVSSKDLNFTTPELVVEHTKATELR